MQDVKYWQDRPKDDAQRDWLYGKESWTEDYWESAEHPHRKVIVDAIVGMDARSVLDVGCNAGPLLRLCKERGIQRLAGIDASAEAIALAKERLPEADLQVGDFTKHIPWAPGDFDVVVADASLMYVHPNDILSVIDVLGQLARRGLIIADRFSGSRLGEPTAKGHIWARNYGALLADFGWNAGKWVKHVKVTEDLWPGSPGWQKDGWIWIAERA